MVLWCGPVSEPDGGWRSWTCLSSGLLVDRVTLEGWDGPGEKLLLEEHGSDGQDGVKGQSLGEEQPESVHQQQEPVLPGVLWGDKEGQWVLDLSGLTWFCVAAHLGECRSRSPLLKTQTGFTEAALPIVCSESCSRTYWSDPEEDSWLRVHRGPGLGSSQTSPHSARRTRCSG